MSHLLPSPLYSANLLVLMRVLDVCRMQLEYNYLVLREDGGVVRERKGPSFRLDVPKAPNVSVVEIEDAWGIEDLPQTGGSQPINGVDSIPCQAVALVHSASVMPCSVIQIFQAATTTTPCCA